MSSRHFPVVDFPSALLTSFQPALVTENVRLVSNGP